MPLSNWAGSVTFSTDCLHKPRTTEEVSDIVAKSSRVRALGTRHSFNDIADTEGEFVSTLHLTEIGKVDREQGCVTLGPGATYAELCTALEGQGYAVHNLASLPHISVGGACATATHGSGDRNGSLSTAVRSIELVTGSGEIIELRRGEDADFEGAVVSLGALGIVVRLTLGVIPAFSLKQLVYEGLEMSLLDRHFDDILSSAYSVSLFTDWKSDRINQVWRKGRPEMAEDPEFFGAKLASMPLHPLPGLPAKFCSPQMGEEAWSHSILPHFRIEFTPSNGEELQTEYIVPRGNALGALHAISEIKDQIWPLLHISEVRSIAADELWLSPFYHRAGIGIHFTWKKDWEGVQRVLAALNHALATFEPRPHWGKIFTVTASEVAARYERLKDFKELAHRLDPSGKFRNRYLDEFLE